MSQLIAAVRSTPDELSHATYFDEMRKSVYDSERKTG